MTCTNSKLYLLRESAIDINTVITNADNNGISDWDAVQAYAVNDVVHSSNFRWVALTANSGNLPQDNLTDWLQDGFDQRYLALDESVNTFSFKDNALTYEFYVDNIDSIAFLKVFASNIDITIYNATTTQQVFNINHSLVSFDDYRSFYGFYFHNRYMHDQYVNYQLPFTRHARIVISINNTDDVAKLGMLKVGSRQEIGTLLSDTKVSIQDYSKKETNQYGEKSVTRRGYADKVNYPIRLLSNSVDRVKRILTEFRSTPVLWMTTTEFTSLTVYGYYNDFTIVVKNSVNSSADIQIEGLI